MKWIRASLYHIVSDDGQFVICMVRVNERQVYELRRAGQTGRPISSHPTAAEAKAAAPQLMEAA